MVRFWEIWKTNHFLSNLKTESEKKHPWCWDILYLKVSKNYITWCFRVAKLFVCIGDWGITPLEGGIPISPHNMVWPTMNRNWKGKLGRCSRNHCTGTTIECESILRNYIPKIPRAASHNDKMRVFLDWTPSAEQVVMQHCDRSSKAQQS